MLFLYLFYFFPFALSGAVEKSLHQILFNETSDRNESGNCDLSYWKLTRKRKIREKF